MNITDLIKQNNELRSQLNEENKKYYEELLIACRMKNTTKKESELEIQLLEILQDLILYQKQGKNFTDVFGNDIHKLSSSILLELPKENKVKLLRFILVYFLILIISAIFPSVFTKTIEPITTMFSILLLALGSSVCLYLLIYKKTEKNKWFIYISSLIIFEISFISIPILNKLKMIPEYLSYKVTVSTSFLYFFGIFCVLSYIYVFLTFKKYYSKKL
jgi:transmembrane protein tmp6